MIPLSYRSMAKAITDPVEIVSTPRILHRLDKYMRASGSDDKMNIAPPKQFSLEQFMEYLRDDEYLEVTPKNLRVRKISYKKLN